MSATAVFYISFAAAPDRTPLTLPSGRVVHVRADEFEHGDLSVALDSAEPRDDESVMNSHYVVEP